jgi:hypothetical protein
LSTIFDRAARFPPTWIVEEAALCFIVRGKNRQKALFQSLDDPKVSPSPSPFSCDR